MPLVKDGGRTFYWLAIYMIDDTYDIYDRNNVRKNWLVTEESVGFHVFSFEYLIFMLLVVYMIWDTVNPFHLIKLTSSI